jgi:hypothetical protein
VSRTRIRRGRVGSQRSCRADRKGDRRNPRADRQHADRHLLGGRRDPQHRCDDHRDQRGHYGDCRGGREQGAATREIARNIQHAATGTSEVSSNIVGVSRASSEAGTAAGDVLASNELRREADMLRSEVDAFLLNIRAA